MRRIGWYLVVAFQFIFTACSLYRRVYVYGRSVPNKTEYRGRYIWEYRGKGPDYCFRLFLGQACSIFAVILILPPGISEVFGLVSAATVVAANFGGYLYEKQRWLKTNREISEAEWLMSERVKELQKSAEAV